MTPFVEVTTTVLVWAACIAWVLMLVSGAALLMGMAINLYWG